MKPTDENVLRAAEKWFRQLLRLEKLWPHEKELFKAVAEKRKADGEKDFGPFIPRAPKVPEIELPEELPDLPPYPLTVRGKPSFTENPEPISAKRLVEEPDDLLTISTKPLPSSEQERLIKAMLEGYDATRK